MNRRSFAKALAALAAVPATLRAAISDKPRPAAAPTQQPEFSALNLAPRYSGVEIFGQRYRVTVDGRDVPDVISLTVHGPLSGAPGSVVALSRIPDVQPNGWAFGPGLQEFRYDGWVVVTPLGNGPPMPFDRNICWKRPTR